MHYDGRVVNDLYTMFKMQDKRMYLGGADEQKVTNENTLGAWRISNDNPIRGWHGLKKGLRSRLGIYLRPLLKFPDLAELSHDSKNNIMRAK